MFNVFQYAAICEKNWECNLGDMTDWKPKYTFYSDFSIAEYCEIYKRDAKAVEDTYNRVIESWGDCIDAMTEVSMVLNHKIWAFYNRVDSGYLGCSDTIADYFEGIYYKLWEKCVAFIKKKFADNKDAMSYYYSVTD